MSRFRGFTLVELVVFIVIAGFAAYALFMSFGSLLPRSPTAAQLAQATQLAQERTELIAGQRLAWGYSGNGGELDPCNKGAPPPPAICTTTFGYTVSSTGTTSGSEVIWNGNSVLNFKLVTVTVKLGIVTLAVQDTVFANY